MNIQMNLFPNGMSRALTMSYDDGQLHDLRLVEVFNRYGIRGTFHLNSANLDKRGYLTADNVAKDFRNHEISSHTSTHPFLTKLPSPIVVSEILEDRRRLEAITGQIVHGMSYPYGQYNTSVISIARDCGMKYSRTVESTGCFEVPDDFMRWHPTCHHSGDLTGLWEKFMNHNPDEMLLFYLWGHSFEFADQNNWSVIEDFCKLAGGHDNVWYATNAEICEYVTACRNLIFSADCSIVYNPSSICVWFTANDRTVSVAPGQTLRLT